MGMALAGRAESPLLGSHSMEQLQLNVFSGFQDSVHSKHCGCFWLNGTAQGSTCPLGTILNSTMIKCFCRKKECITAYSYCEEQSV